MSPGEPDVAIVRRHLLALDAAMQRLRRHAGRPLAALVVDPDTLWAIERGLQLCAQNALDIATHLTASAGRDTPDYASAIDTLGQLGFSRTRSPAGSAGSPAFVTCWFTATLPSIPDGSTSC
jgi:uncharacterized protein YutE (UPF0331/DUF86 family)